MRLRGVRVGFVLMSLTLSLSDRPSVTGAQRSASTRIVLSEVLFAPRPDDTAFVELANVGTGSLDLSNFVLRVDTVDVPLPQLAAPLAPGARVLIRFDGPAPTEGNVIHASGNVVLNTEGGSVTLLSNGDRVLDRVAWGDAPGAIMPLQGGNPPVQVETGSSFGRPPGAYQPGASTDWVIYSADQVTPGRPNPLPAVFQLLPVTGAILEATPATLTWYPVQGAVRYRVEVARDTTFTPLIFDQTVAVPEVSSGALPLGVYWWRVQALPAEGPPASWSRPSRITFESRPPGGDDGAQGYGDAGDRDAPAASGDRSAQNTNPVVLPVPMIYQYKDGPMLLLESHQSGGPRTKYLLPENPHAWDRDHGDLDKTDPADDANCGLATMAMINRFYGGDLTQDRIGYEVFGPNVATYQARIPTGFVLGGRALRERAPGPEEDLNYHYGLSNRLLVAAGLFALGAGPGPGSGYGPNFTTLPTMWNTIVQEIDAGRPVAGIVPGHLLVIRGYEIRNGERLVWVNDPWRGQYALSFDLSSPVVHGSLEAIFTWPSHPAIGHLEPESKRDSDGDDVYDFDEIYRFHTDPNKKDTDGDGVPDYRDIESGVYQDGEWPPLGFAFGGPGRDYDADGKPTELDSDSDNGGCKDGEEDTSASGSRESPETSNFDQADDVCGTLHGSLNYETELASTNPNDAIRVVHDEGVIVVRLKPRSPGSDHYVDDGSTFNYRGFARIELGDPTCKIIAREVATGGGLIATDGEIGATRGNDGTLSVGAGAQVKGHSSTGGCGLAGSNNSSRGMSWPGTCSGKLAPTSPTTPTGAKGTITYRFDCTSVTPPPGIRVIHYHARGFVRLQTP